jgi:hypothetical protein
MKLPRLPSFLASAAYGMLLLAAAVPLFNRYLAPETAPGFVLGAETALSKAMPVMKLGYACEACPTPSVHGANVIETRDGGLLATWFGGAREGATDVALWGAEYSLQSRSWSEPRRIIGAAETQAALGRHIKTVGNSVLARDEQGGLWLYYVSVSVGGWAGSALNVMHSSDEGQSWDAPRRLITSSFFNISTLNKSMPLAYEDGSIALPVYHEFIGKFSELLRLDPAGRYDQLRGITQQCWRHERGIKLRFEERPGFIPGWLGAFEEDIAAHLCRQFRRVVRAQIATLHKHVVVVALVATRDLVQSGDCRGMRLVKRGHPVIVAVGGYFPRE